MSRKLLLLLCAQLLVQSISSQCIGAIDAPWAATPINAAPCTGAWGEPFAAEWACSPAATLAASNGPGLVVSTASPVVPAGVSIISNNAYEGALAVGGALPFLGTVAIEGALPTAGAGAIAYGCGNGAVGITAENFGAVGFGTNGASLIAAPLTMGPLATAPLTIGPKAAGPCIESWNAADLAASNGPGVAVSTVSPLIPTGVSVLSANAYEGVLAAGGALPFLGTVALEGVLPTAGAGAVAYGCGNGAVGITTEDMGAIGFTGIAGPLGYGSGLAGPLGYGAARAGSFGIAGPGCGCGYGAIY